MHSTQCFNFEATRLQQLSVKFYAQTTGVQKVMH